MSVFYYFMNIINLLENREKLRKLIFLNNFRHDREYVKSKILLREL